MADVQNFSGIVTPVASVPGKCGLVITPGAQPTVPEPGGVWYDIEDDAFALFSVDGTVTYLPKGNGIVNQVLTSNGASSVPTWKAGASGQGFVSSQTGTGSLVGNVTTETTLASLNALPADCLTVV